MKTTVRYTDQGQCIVITSNRKVSKIKTAFTNMETAAAEIGILQSENLSLMADIEELKDELEECEDYDARDEDEWNNDDYDNKRLD